MSSVDDRIVNMQFNNKQFKAGVTESQQSLDNLEKSLSKTANTKGLNDLGKNVDAVKQKFSVMQVAGVAAVATVASKAASAGVNLVKSLTLSPIMDGFREYQTNLQSIQTIMANTGKKVGTVNKYLTQLNHYSDQTIYNFSQMASSIGKFTSAGVDLKTSTAAIKGMANTAALSGASVDDLNRAMYQMSQALASGSIRLQDWNSVVNANMGGKNLQNALIETSRSLGGSVDAAIKKEGNFRESLKDGWLTTDVFNKTMKVMAGRMNKATGMTEAYSVAQLKSMGYTEKQAKSLHSLSTRALEAATQIKTLPQMLDVVKESIGSVWGQVFQGVMGNFSQSKELWTAAGNALTTQVSRIGVVLVGTNGNGGIIGGWRKGIAGVQASGRTLIIQGFRNIAHTIGSVIGTVAKAFQDVFPPNAVSTLRSISKGFRDFTRLLVPSAETLDSLRSIFGGVFAVLHIGLTIVGGIATAFKSFFGAILANSGGASSGILKMAAGVGEALKAFDRFLTQGGKFTAIMSGIGKTAGAIVGPVVAGIGAIIKAFAALVTGQGIGGFMSQLDTAKGKFAEVGSIVSGLLAKATAPFSTLSHWFDVLQQKLDGISHSFGGVSSAVGGVSSAVGGMSSKVGGLAGGASSALGGVANKVGSLFGDSPSSSPATGSGSSADAGPSTSTAKAYDTVAKSASSASTAVNALYTTMSGSTAAAAVTSTDKLAKAGESSQSSWAKVKAVFGVLGHGISVVFDALGKAASFVKNAFSALFGSYDALDWASVLNAVLTGVVLVSIKDFIKSFKNITGITDSINGAFNQLKDTLKTMAASVKYKIITAIAVAVGILTASLIALSFIDPEKLAMSLAAITIMINELVAAMKILGGIGSATDVKKAAAMAEVGASMTLMSSAILVLAGAVKILGSMDLKTLEKGLGAMSYMMTILTAAFFAMGKTGPVAASVGGAMLLASMGMVAIAGAVAIFGQMDVKTLAKGIGAVAYAITIVSAAMLILGEAGPASMAGAAALVMAAMALNILTGAVAIFGLMNPEKLAQGLSAMTKSILIMTVALAILGAIGPATLAGGAAMLLVSQAMVILAGAIGILGAMSPDTVSAGIAAIGKAILIIGGAALIVAPGLIVLGVAVAAIGTGLLAAGIGMALFGAGFAVVVAAGTAGVAVLTVAINAFIGLLPAIATQIAAAFVSFLETIASMMPRIRKAFDTIFQSILGVITDNIPAVGKLFRVLISEAIKTIRNTVSQWVNAGIYIIDKFLSGLDKHLPNIIEKGTDIVVKLLDGLGKAAGRIAHQAGQTILDILHAIDDAVVQYTGPIRDEGLQIAYHLVDGLTGGLVSYARSHLSAAIKQVADMIPGPLRKFLGIKSPSRVMMEIGMYVALGLAKGIANNTGRAVAAAIVMAKAVVAGTNKELNKLEDTANKKQAQADRAQAAADVAKQKLKTIPKKNKKARAKQQKVVDRLQGKADTAQGGADSAAQSVSDRRDFQNMSLADQGAKLDENAQAAAAKAQKLMFKANAEAQAAMKLHGKARRAMLDRSNADAISARGYAAQAQAAHKRAAADYEADIKASADALAAKIQADKDQRDWQEKFDKADAATQAHMLTDRATSEQAEAERKKAEAQRLIQKARAEAATNHEQAVKDLQAASDAADAAEQAADAAKQDQSQADQLLAQTTQAVSNASGGTTASSITPSRSVLEDAASAVDRYTASLQLAESSAAAQPQVTQFVQNNYSPKALSEIDTYRNGKNLLALHEIKMGANS